MSHYQFLTCIFKIHNPSAHKRAVMDHALHEYTVAYSALLEEAKRKDAIIQERGIFRDNYNGKAIAAFLERPVGLQLHGSAVESLLQDVAGNLASYYALMAGDFNPTYPVGRDTSPGADDAATQNFIECGADNDDYNQSKARYLKQMRDKYMPVFFCRSDGASQTKTGAARNRNFSLLSDDNGRLFAVLYLLPARHGLGKQLGATNGNLYRLDTGEAFTSNSSTAIIVPLQVGRNGWQANKFLEPSRKENVEVKTAFLVKNDSTGEYFLHVAFKFTSAPRYTPEAFVGVDKGIVETAAYAVIDQSGSVLGIGHFSDELRALQIKHGREREKKQRNGKTVTVRDYKLKSYDQILHTIANDIIAMAKGHRAGIVVEDLGIQVKGGRVVSRFRKLDRILEYKCNLAGVPFRHVFAAYSSVICHQCGEDLTRGGRDDYQHVWCTHCGYDGHSDDNAAVNIARRALYKKAAWSGGYREFHRSFRQETKNALL
jgi:putative transposase